MSQNETTPTYQIMIPEAAVTSQIESFVTQKVDKERIEKILHSTVLKHRDEIISGLREDVIHKTTQDFQDVRGKIIEDFLESKRTEIVLDRKVVATIDDPTAHKELPRLLTYLQLFQQAMVVGPTGSGKSTLAKQAATAMNLRYASFSCNMEASKSELVGFANINGYIESQFLDFYENGGLFLIDEYDAMSPSIAVVLNAVFDRTGQISVPNRTGKTVAKKHKDFYCVLAGNTWGSGSVEYQGRDMQDMAFLDRFKLCRIFIDYDEQIEKHIAGEHYDWFLLVRNFISEFVDGDKFSTRSIHDACVLLANGATKADIINMVSYQWEPEVVKKFIKAVFTPTMPA